jgi:hypothetical protein
MRITVPSRFKSHRGALMAAALLLMIVSGMFMTAWVSLLSSRSAQVGFMETILKRRISVENSRQFAWECALEKAFDPGSNLSSGTSGTLGASFGGLSSHDGWSALNIYTSTRTPGAMTTVFPYNYTGMRPMSSYLSTEQLKRPSSLTAVDDFNAYLFLKTYSPVLAGDLLTYFRKPEGSSYNSRQIEVMSTAVSNALWTVEGRTVIRDNASFFARTTPSPMQLPFYTRSLYIQSHDTYNSRAILGTTTNAAGTATRLLPSNLPAVPSTTGPVSSDTDDRFAGYLNVVNNALNPDNSLWHFMQRESLAGRGSFVEIDVFSRVGTSASAYWMEDHTGNPDDQPLHPPFDYSLSRNYIRTLYIRLGHPDLPHLRISGNSVDQIVLLGQTSTSTLEAAGAMRPIMIAIDKDESRPLNDITLVDDNNRRIVVGLKVARPSNRGLYMNWLRSTASIASHDWRMVFINEGQLVTLKLPASLSQNVRWIGGVMTNWSFKRYFADGTSLSRLRFVSDASVSTLTPASPSLASLLPRDAWLESYFLPTPP